METVTLWILCNDGAWKIFHFGMRSRLERHRLLPLRHLPRDAHPLFSLLNLEFGDAGSLDKIDEGLELSEIHAGTLRAAARG